MAHYINSSGLFQAPDLLKVQADIISTPEDLQADDAAVSALMMESDITAPIKEQCEENARLMRRIASLEQTNRDLRELVVSWQQVAMEAEQKAKKYENACKAMANCLHELEG